LSRWAFVPLAGRSPAICCLKCPSSLRPTGISNARWSKSIFYAERVRDLVRVPDLLGVTEGVLDLLGVPDLLGVLDLLGVPDLLGVLDRDGDLLGVTEEEGVPDFV
jgi:hypothetical protein